MDNDSGGPLSLDNKSVREILLEKHPNGNPMDSSAITLPEFPTQEPHPVIFDQITGSLIRSVALQMEGAPGPPNVDSYAWRRICTSFHRASSDICEALAALARRMCTTYVDPSGLSAFSACRLIALDKCPGVRPIGVGEVVRRIVGKAVLNIIGEEIQEVAGTSQVCAGQQAGCEAAVHAMTQIFEDPHTQAVILVDASNAFNNLNREVALRNILTLCPALSKIIVNTYRDYSKLLLEVRVFSHRRELLKEIPWRWQCMLLPS